MLVGLLLNPYVVINFKEMLGSFVQIVMLAFHVSLNSCNIKLKNGGDHWGSLHTRIALHVSFKAMYFVL